MAKDQKDQHGEDEVINVQATMVGFYNNRRHYPEGFDHPRQGEVFQLRSIKRTDPKTGKTVIITARKQFSEKWMIEVSPEEAAKDAQVRGRHPVKKALITKDAAHRAPAGVI